MKNSASSLNANTTLQQESYLPGLWSGGTWQPLVLGWRLKGRLDVAALRTCVDHIVARQDALRMSFPMPQFDRCLVASPEDVPSALSQLESPGAAGALVVGTPALAALRDYLYRPFTLEELPRLRVAVIELSANDWLLGIAADHLNWDGISVGLFLSQLGTLYGTFLQHGSVPDDREPPSYAELARTQRERMSGAWGEERRSFWFNYFDRWGPYYPVTGLGETAGIGSVAEECAWKFSLDKGRITKLARMAGTTPFAVFAGLLLKAEMSITGTASAGAVFDINGRTLPQSETTLGLLAHGSTVHVSRAEAADESALAEIAGDRIWEVNELGLPLRPLCREWRAHKGLAPATGPQPHIFLGAFHAQFEELELAGLPADSLPLSGGPVKRASGSSEALHVTFRSGLCYELKVHFHPAVFQPDAVRSLLKSAFDVDTAAQLLSGTAVTGCPGWGCPAGGTAQPPASAATRSRRRPS